jgi:hypothetical protein
MKIRYNALWNRFTIVRAIKTMIQCLIAMIAMQSIMHDVYWMYIMFSCLAAGICSIFTSLFGIPEAMLDGELQIDTSNPEKDTYRLQLDTAFDELPKKKIVVLSIDSNADLSALKKL